MSRCLIEEIYSFTHQSPPPAPQQSETRNSGTQVSVLVSFCHRHGTGDVEAREVRNHVRTDVDTWTNLSVGRSLQDSFSASSKGL